MADQSTQSITIDAQPAAIMAVIADFPAYPQWTGSLKSAKVLEQGSDGRAKRVHFTLDAGVVKDQYELEYIWSGDDRVEWNLVKGQMQKLQHGSSRCSRAVTRPRSPTRSRSTWPSPCWACSSARPSG